MAFVFAPGILSATGLSAYQQGNYQGALKDFEQRLPSGAVAAEIKFDAGAAAYKAGDFKKAAGFFSEAMTAGKKKIKEAATYNLANALVRTGEAAQESDAKLSEWKNALQHYDTVLKATPANAQAKENRDIVLKLNEDLKKLARMMIGTTEFGTARRFFHDKDGVPYLRRSKGQVSSLERSPVRAAP